MLQVNAGEPAGESSETTSPRPSDEFNGTLIRPHSGEATPTRLAISEPGDGHEQGADRLAEHVMATPESQLSHACPYGGQCAPCQSEQPVQPEQHSGLPPSHVQASGAGRVPARPSVHDVVRSPGQPLDPATRAFMEPRFGYDFSQVRIHSDAAAARSARDVNADAYTVGRDVVFGAGQFVPGTKEGRRLIAHELAHVMQTSEAQRGPGPALAHVVQRQPGQYYEKTESDVAESVVEALQQSNNIAGSNVDPAFEMLNPYPLPFQMKVLADLYDRGYFYGLLGYLAPGTKASRGLVVAIRFTQCQKDPNSLAYEDILEAQSFIQYYVPVPVSSSPCSNVCSGNGSDRRSDEKRNVGNGKSRRKKSGSPLPSNRVPSHAP